MIVGRERLEEFRVRSMPLDPKRRRSTSARSTERAEV